MLFSLVILLLIIFNIYRGYQTGLVTEFVRVLSYLIALMIAFRLARPVGQLLPVGRRAWADGIAFLAVLVVAVMILRKLGSLFTRLTRLPIFYQLDEAGGAILGGVIGYLLVFLGLSVVIALPSPWLQQQYSQSTVAYTIVNRTPVLTHNLLQSWLK